MPQTVNSLQVYRGKSWSGLTTDNHLGTLFQEQPYLASSVMSRVFGMYDYMGMDAFLNYMGAEEEFPDDRDFEWNLKGDDEKAVRVVSYTSSDTNRPGVNNTNFTITFPEKYFAYRDKLVPDNRDYPVRVMGEPVADGTDWVYTVQLMTGDPTLFMPVTLLTSGSQFSKEYSPVSKTLSKGGGLTSYTSPFKLRNSFSTIRKEDVIAGNMINRPLVIEMLDPKSNKGTKVWTQYAEWAFLAQWFREKNRALLYGTSNKTAQGTYKMKDDSGFEIREGAGLHEQISPSYKFSYTTFTIDWLEDVLLNLSIHILPEDQRHFVALTGERGMVQFHRALQNHASRFQPLDSKRIGGSGQNLSFQGQYRQYIGPQGTAFTLLHVPEYDNIVTNRIPHPDGGFTESYKYTILNFGTSNGKKNIRRVYPKGEREKLWHIAGSSSPLGPNTSFKSGASSAVDGYEIHAMAKQGLIVENPLTCAELRYSSTS